MLRYGTFQKANNKGADQTAQISAQDGLRLCCWQPAEDRFSRLEAQIMGKKIITFSNLELCMIIAIKVYVSVKRSEETVACGEKESGETTGPLTAGFIGKRS